MLAAWWEECTHLNAQLLSMTILKEAARGPAMATTAMAAMVAAGMSQLLPCVCHLRSLLHKRKR
jgi:hypothetical protein